MAMIAAWTNFLGANTKIHPKRLREGFGRSSSNQRFGFGDLRGINEPLNVATIAGTPPSTPAVVSLYRMERATVSDTAEWIWWEFSDVDVVRSLIPTDTDDEIFYTGDAGESGPRRTNKTLALPAAPGPAASEPLGIPQPTDPMTATTLVAGTGPNEERVYVDTFYDPTNLREGAPTTAPTTGTFPGGTTVTLASFGAVPAGYSDVTVRRIYCSTSGGPFLYVTEAPATDASIVDDATRTQDVLQSGGASDKPAWLEPVTEMLGLIGLWNGMVGGFRGKELCICEPYKPWAWPAEYRILLHDDIVGTGMWGQNWVVLTTAGPYIIRGSSPLNMSPERLPFDMSCMSKRSIVSMNNGVAWVSQNGVCYMGDGFPPAIVTEGFISPEQWRDDYAASATDGVVVGMRFENECLFAFQRAVPSSESFVLILNPRADIGFTLRTYTGLVGPIGGFYDPLSDRLYFPRVESSVRKIDRWGAGSQSTVTYRTRTVRHVQPCNPGYMLVVADTSAVSVELYGDDVLRHTQATVTPGVPMSLPSGYQARDFDVIIESAGNVQGVLLAEDASDLV